MSGAVAAEAAVLTAHSLKGANTNQVALLQAFNAATEEAGRAFESSFTPEGKKIADQEPAYKAAQKVAGGVALDHLPEALHAADIEQIDGQIVVDKVIFEDVVRLTARQLNTDAPNMMSTQAMRDSLHQTVDTSDYFADKIDTLPRPEREYLPISRLANATWAVGQVHRAAWEGNDNRIDPIQREAFNPYDLLKQQQYQRLLDEGRTSDEAVVRVAFEVWKDVDQLRTEIPADQQLIAE
jgi:hypothetical protein